MRRFLTNTVWGLAILAAGLGIFNMVDLVTTDLPGDYVEGVVLAAQRQVEAGKPLYHQENWTERPYSINLYGPVGYHLGALMAGFCSNPSSLIPGRLMSFFGLLMALGALWSLQRSNLGLNRSDAILGLLIPLGYLPIVIFGAQYRVDVLAIAFGLWGLVLGSRQRWGLWIAPLFFVLAVFTKPTTIAAVLALGLWWLGQKQWRPIVVVAAGCLVLGFLGLGALTMATEGAFTDSVFGFNALPFAIGGLLHAADSGLGGGLLALGCAIAVTTLAVGNQRQRLPALYLLIATAMTFATVGRVGANFNYFIEPGLIMGPVIALAWSQRADKNDQHVPTIGATAVLAAVLATSLVWVGPRVVFEKRGRSERDAIERRLARWIEPGDSVLSSEIVSVYRLKAEPYLNDPFIFARLSEGGQWNQDRMLEDLRTGYMTWVLADEDMAAPKPVHSNWTAETRDVVAANFEAVDHISRFTLYRWTPRP